MLKDFLQLIFPNRCRACERNLVRNEKILCTFCHYRLPRTNYHLMPENPVVKQFWGKTNVHNATAFFFFRKGDHVQHLIHLLKYKGDKEIGLKLGNMFGCDLNESKLYQDVDFLIPVPLHAGRRLSRGYNQSEVIARGLEETLKVPVNTGLLSRTKATATQTKKKRFTRYENMKEVFKIKNLPEVHGKHFLIIDDVITTGSTVAACAEKLLEIPGSKISVAALAYAYH